MPTTTVRGAELVIGDVIHSGHSYGSPITVHSFDRFNDSEDDRWFLVCQGEHVREPYRSDELVEIEVRQDIDVAALIAFRNHVRSIVHATDDEGDVTVLAALRSDHDTASDLNGCAGCD